MFCRVKNYLIKDYGKIIFATVLILCANSIITKKRNSFSNRSRGTVDFGKFSYNLQEKREESLINQSGKMLTAYPVTMAILTWLIPKTAVVSMYILFFGLTLSLIFAILAGWRFKNRRMPGIESFFEDVENNMEKYDKMRYYRK